LKIHESISLDKNSDEAMYIQLYENIKNFIENGTLKKGEKLPAIRAMADKIGVNNITVVNAYKLLEQKGYVYSKTGSGTFVKDQSKSENYMSDGESDIREQEFVKINTNQINPVFSLNLRA
jgi:DNA-binding transcriptional regulator YhcF (GntR family)